MSVPLRCGRYRRPGPSRQRQGTWDTGDRGLGQGRGQVPSGSPLESSWVGEGRREGKDKRRGINEVPVVLNKDPSLSKVHRLRDGVARREGERSVGNRGALLVCQETSVID